MSKTQFTSATCPTCLTDFDRLPVDYTADGDAYAALEVTPCADAECGAFLCACCSQFACAGCGHTFCASHLVRVPDGTDQPLKCCAACASECEPCELPAPMPPQSETRPARRMAEVA